MPRLRVGDLELFHDVDGDGEPLLLLTGLGGDHHAFDLVRRDLARRHRVVLVDHRDAGASDEARSAYALGDLAADALAVMDALGIERFHVLGASMGVEDWSTIKHLTKDQINHLILNYRGPGSS